MNLLWENIEDKYCNICIDDIRFFLIRRESNYLTLSNGVTTRVTPKAVWMKIAVTDS